MGCEPGYEYEHDVFVSYARVDDVPEVAEDTGWVTTLVEALRIGVDQKLGKRGSCRIWMDHHLRGNERLTPAIIRTVEKSATMLVVMSPGYLASDWCQQELECFFAPEDGPARPGNSLFLVHLDDVERDDLSWNLLEYKGYRFWAEAGPERVIQKLTPQQPRIGERDYRRELDRLRRDVANRLKERPDGDIAPKRPVVLLAEASDDVDADREAVLDYLDQAGVQVLRNRGDRHYPRSEGDFVAAVDKDLAKCSVFAQLLGALPGKRPPGCEKTYTMIQVERAQAAKKTILQWRDPALDVEAVAKSDSVYGCLIEGPTVQAVPLERFKHAVKAAVVATRPGVVHIRPNGGDSPPTEQISQALQSNAIATFVCERDPLREALKYLNGLLLLYCEGPEDEMELRILMHDELRYTCQPPLPLGVYQHPPPGGKLLDFALRGSIAIDGRAGFDERKLMPFVEKVLAHRGET